MARAARESSIPADRLAAYDRLIGTIPGLARKGATVPYTSLNGHMFSFLDDQGRLAIRLPRPEREAFLERHQATLHEAYGTIMKEWVRVPDALLEDTGALAPTLAASHAHVASLPPKPTKRKTAPRTNPADGE